MTHTDVLDSGTFEPSEEEGNSEYLGPWSSTYGLRMVAINSDQFESENYIFMIQESMDGIDAHAELGPFNSAWWTPTGSYGNMPPNWHYFNTWVPGMAYVRLHIMVPSAGMPPVKYSLRGIS